MTITRAHLTDSVHNRLDLPKAKSAGLVEPVFETMKNTLENGEDILISGFGKFCIKGKRDRRGRNPWTGEDMVLGSRRIVTFKCSGALKHRLNGRKR
jgi:integration host factor subunit alpha